MRKVIVGLVVLLVAGAFVAGYWPQREKLRQAQAEVNELRRQLAESRSEVVAAEARARLGRLLGRYLALRDAVASGNFGEAQTLSSPFFDEVRNEAVRAPEPTARAALEAALIRRDAVTAGLARGEGSIREVLVPIERELRSALGYPVQPLAPAPPVPEEARP